MMGMRVIVDTSVLLAVVLNEPEKSGLVAMTKGIRLAAPAVMPYEIGNALSALVKRHRLTGKQALEAWHLTQAIAVELLDIPVADALSLAISNNIYAYDAYFLHTAHAYQCPILTLDRNMSRLASKLNLRVLEVA